MSKKLYALTDEQAKLGREIANLVSKLASTSGESGGPARCRDVADALATPLDTDDAVERMARALAELEPGDQWPTNAELGGGPTGDRDVEYHQGLLQEARAALDALLQEGNA